MFFFHSIDPAGLQQSHVITKPTNHDSSFGYDAPCEQTRRSTDSRPIAIESFEALTSQSDEDACISPQSTVRHGTASPRCAEVTNRLVR
jgi:hypothetical protein